MGGSICSRFAVLFSEREGHDFIGHIESSDTSFCFDHPGAAHFRASANILGRDDFASVGLAMASRQMGKNAKFYPWPIVAWAPLWVLK